MSFARLENVCQRGNHIGNMCSKDEFTKASIDKPERRYGVNKNEQKGNQQNKKCLWGKRRELIEKVRNEGDRRERSDGDIQGIITERQPIFARFTFLKRFHIEAEDFRQQVHAHLGKEDTKESQPEEIGLESLAEVIGNARTEEIRQRGKEKSDGTGETEESFQILDFRLTIYNFREQG